MIISFKVLEKKGYTSSNSKCFLQSFEKKGIEQLKGKTNLKRNFLMDDNNKEYKELWPEVLKWAKQNDVTGFGLSKTFLVVPKGFQQDNKDLDPKDVKHENYTDASMIEDAHDAGMDVHVFTFRNEDEKLLFEYGQDPYNEFEKFLSLGIDGYFTDFPATAKRFLDTASNNSSNNTSSKYLSQLTLLFSLFLYICSGTYVKRSIVL